VVPWRQGRPNESLTITATSIPDRSEIAARRQRAEASGSRGRSTTVSGCPAFDESTPADAQTKPCWVSAMTRGGRERTIVRLSRRITSMRRGSPSPASSRARERPCVECTPGRDPLREPERQLLRRAVVPAHEGIFVGLVLAAELRRRQGVQAGDNWAGELGLELLGK